MDTHKPYLIIPKLIEQPTWGGYYIAKTKGWDHHIELENKKIGQAYELYQDSNLSLFTSSSAAQFHGELTNSKDVEKRTSIPNSITMSDLIQSAPLEVLGKAIVNKYGPKMHLLIKFTQAQGNSFQLHVKEDTPNTVWLAKPESWYYFEPGFITLGVKNTTDWNEYQSSANDLQNELLSISIKVKDGKLTLKDAQLKINECLQKYNLWQYVNFVYPEKDSLIDLSAGAIHHSWEEDASKCPLGNVVYELQLNVMDGISTIRSFDKGKMTADGSIRPLHIDDYFNFIDRSGAANDPQNHTVIPQKISNSNSIEVLRLLQTKHYTLEKVTLLRKGSKYTHVPTHFRHVFVKSGDISLKTSKTTLEITRGHSAFIPYAVGQFELEAKNDHTEVLISY